MVPFSCFTAEETRIHKGMGRSKSSPSKSVAEARQDRSVSRIELLLPCSELHALNSSHDWPFAKSSPSSRCPGPGVPPYTLQVGARVKRLASAPPALSCVPELFCGCTGVGVEGVVCCPFLISTQFQMMRTPSEQLTGSEAW